MERRVASFARVVLLLALVLFTRPAQGVEKSRQFNFTYAVTVKALPFTADQVRVWIPLASSNAYQRVRIVRIVASVPTQIIRGRSFGNRILYADIHHPRFSLAKFTIIYAVTRYEYSRGTHAALRKYGKNPNCAPVSEVRFLRPDRLVPVGGIIAHIAREMTRGKPNAVDDAYAFYNYVFHNMRYDKSGTGWGRGNVLWACYAKHGNCTDFHSLFIALARASGIPARFDIGFPLPSHATEGVIPGYHCWAEFYIDRLGWVPVDISEAWLDPSKHDFFFGSLDANRIQFSTGRDLTLSPKQDGPPLNYFIYPYVELDGKPYTSIEKRFTFHDFLGRPRKVTRQSSSKGS
jgi:transglutaminase-like putative cysteine protease